MALSKTIFITGASTGIGKAAVIHLNKLGYSIIASVRKKEDFEKLISEVENPKTLSMVLLDLTQVEQIKTIPEKIKSMLGDKGLFALINNAGIVVGGPIELISAEDVQYQIQLNVIGQIQLTQQLIPFIRKGQGRIINIGSSSGRVVYPFMGIYAATKFAMLAFSDGLRMELKPWDIPVSLIEPGAIATPLWDKTLENSKTKFQHLPEEQLSHYQDMLTQAQRVTENVMRNAASVDSVTKVIDKIVKSKNPRPYYKVGRLVRVPLLLSHILPAKLFDRLKLFFYRK